MSNGPAAQEALGIRRTRGAAGLVVGAVLAVLASPGLAGAAAPAGEGGGGAEGGSEEAASEATRAKQLYEEGMAANEADEYEKAAELFERAYELDPNFALLWNAARAHHRAGHYEQAAQRYKDVLAHDELPTKYQPKAAEYLSDVRLEMERSDDEGSEGAAASGAEEGGSEGVGEGDDGSESRDAVAAGTVTEEEAARARRPSPWGWASMGGGLAMLGAGVALHFNAESIRDDAEAAGRDGIVEPDEPCSGPNGLAGCAQTANKRDRVGGALMAIGGAATAAGIVVLLTTGGEEEPATTPEAAFGTVPLRGGGLVSVQGTF